MENQNYTIANIPGSCQSNLDKMEKELSKETDRDIILVAYEKNR